MNTEKKSRVGGIYRLKVPCLGNEAGADGICFNDYGSGFQVIFPNGNYDGFNSVEKMPNGQVEADYFLELVGYDPIDAGYQFENVMQVGLDFNSGKLGRAIRGRGQ